ncbi:MAG TPA: 4-hydroxythreonine-4-phosphate dehydrogenase PdxA [Polyangiaceae bacterium]|nr:4-hydroxythreonine-4-phosphate dehydrogenase PdxA [Polyangiaceae bacterium]
MVGSAAPVRTDLLVVSVGCPCGIGPEVSVRAAAQVPGTVLVGDADMLREAAVLVKVSPKRIRPFEGQCPDPRAIYVQSVGPKLLSRDRKPGKPNATSGAAQLAYIEEAYRLAKAAPRRALVTGPVSKAAIAHSGVPGAQGFLGHTEWLRDLDHATLSVMCFAAGPLVTSLVTTHLPIAKVPKALTPLAVSDSAFQLAQLLLALGKKRPKIAVCSLNPHAGESELLGQEERTAIVPGIRAAAKRVGQRAELLGPIGAETAFRKAAAGVYQGVVAMYHDQATIPMKLVAFGDAVNVTMGLSIVRTSVDHGTAYDIAWKGVADAAGMRSAMELGRRLISSRR